ncbi:MAG: ATP-grasp domain-containing protein [Chloroflexi bacterium]|nr:ATP-grasp domain-containing protein [Chloroflexota bacterium]
MKLVFWTDLLKSPQPDLGYADEVAAAHAAGFETVLLDIKALAYERDVRATVRHIQPSDQPTPALYRGLMLKPALYAELYDALKTRGLLLINDPAAYRHCQSLPESYPIIAPHLPRTVALPLTPNAPLPDLTSLLLPFGDHPLRVRYYAQSYEYDLYNECILPNAADQPEVQRIMTHFLEMQSDDLNEGVVFHEFVDSPPLMEAFRLWFVDGQRIFTAPYWEDDAYTTSVPDDLFAEVARQVQSRFFMIDVVRRLDGNWQFFELVDGQVASLPMTADVALFYRALRAALAP